MADRTGDETDLADRPHAAGPIERRWLPAVRALRVISS
jgi:hypothetical protein